MLMPDKFRIIKSFITDFNVNANPDYDPSAECLDKALDWEFDLDCVERDDGVYAVRFEVDCEDEVSPYYFDFKAIVFIKAVDDDEPTDDHKKSATAYGLQVLYGMAREHLYMISSRGPWGERCSIWLGLCDVAKIMTTFEEKFEK